MRSKRLCSASVVQPLPRLSSDGIFVIDDFAVRIMRVAGKKTKDPISVNE